MNISTEMLREVFANNRIVYASVPITTGWRYMEWLKAGGDPDDKDARYRYVVQPNIKHGRKSIAALRRRMRCMVIDPSQLENVKLNWEQVDYYRFWDAIIKDVATELVFMDGWECSTGCCHELISALEAGKPIFTQDRTPLSVERAMEMIGKSLDAYRQLGQENPALERILKTLGEMI